MIQRPLGSRPFSKIIGGAVAACLAAALASCSGGAVTGAIEEIDSNTGAIVAAATDTTKPSGAITREQQNSPLYQAYQAYLRQRADAAQLRLAAGGGVSDTQATYAAKCDIATGVHVPSFTCGNGAEVPGQTSSGSGCLKPNVLHGACDPGSKFQVLPGATADGVAVAHCRKVGLPATGSTTYNDIAVIQYNKKNGAVCFYQALTNVEGNNVPAPSVDTGFWISPAGTEAIKCTGCHNNGAFIRSPYLAQLATPAGSPNLGSTSHLPSTADGYDNNVTPLKFVGSDYATNLTWAVTTARAPSDTGLACTTCHRMAVSNELGFGYVNGSGGHFALLATARTQASKVPHSASSPIWMRPGQIFYGKCSNSTNNCNQDSECGLGTCNSGAAASAALFNSCSTNFWGSNAEHFTSGNSVPGCSFTPLGAPFAGFSPAQAVSGITSILL